MVVDKQFYSENKLSTSQPEQIIWILKLSILTYLQWRHFSFPRMRSLLTDLPTWNLIRRLEFVNVCTERGSNPSLNTIKFRWNFRTLHKIGWASSPIRSSPLCLSKQILQWYKKKNRCSIMIELLQSPTRTKLLELGLCTHTYRFKTYGYSLYMYTN